VIFYFRFFLRPSCHRGPDVDIRVNNAPLNVKSCVRGNGMQGDSVLMGKPGHIGTCSRGACAPVTEVSSREMYSWTVKEGVGLPRIAA
jgi:hypothetical protein